MTDNTNKIYADIKQNLSSLFKIAPDNKNLLKLDQATEYLQNNPEGLLIIQNGLEKINKSVTKINKHGEKQFSSIIEDILISVKYN
ncbi:MAG: hypothetical protein QM490_04135 [Candidatus Gracilibacteria bacterium]